MAYICTKTKGNKKYYYLRKSIKGKGKCKDICYLGRDISKINLKELENKFPNEIKDSKKILKRFIESNFYFEQSRKNKIKENRFFSKKQLMEIEAILTHFRKLKSKTKKETQEKFKIEFITENISLGSVENNLFNTKETEKILKQGIIPKNKSIIQIYKIINTNKILEFLEQEKPILNLKLIEKIPKIILREIFEIGYRKQNKKIPKKPFGFSKAENTKSDLKKLLSWHHKNKTKIPPLALAILFHNKFQKIHPFAGLNGETGRILLNYQLFELGYPPLIIPNKSKKEYYKVMDKAYRCLKNDLLNTDMKYYKALIGFIQKQFVKTYWDNFVV